jgi:hypothetical protein
MYEGYKVVSGNANEQIFFIELSPLSSLFFPLRPTSPVAIYQQIINTYSAFYFYFFFFNTWGCGVSIRFVPTVPSFAPRSCVTAPGSAS